MTAVTPGDAAFGICHLIMARPAIGLAVCLIAGATQLLPNTVEVQFPDDSPLPRHSECFVGEGKYVLVELAGIGDAVVGDCFEHFDDPITFPELQARCIVQFQPASWEAGLCALVARVSG